MNYSNLAFTETIRSIQERMGSRMAYERVEQTSFKDGLSPVETDFIGKLDSFYMASFG